MPNGLLFPLFVVPVEIGGYVRKPVGFADAHLSDDEGVAKMGHPEVEGVYSCLAPLPCL